MVKHINGFSSWLNKIRLLLGIGGVIVGAIAVTVLGYAAICNDIVLQGNQIISQMDDIALVKQDVGVVTGRVDMNSMAILKIQTQLDTIQQMNIDYQQENRQGFRQIMEKLK